MATSWSTWTRGVGEVLKALDETGLADQTLIVFTSDNGPDTRGPYDKRGQAFPAGGQGDHA
jgi:arylsulfatase A-like enzyme